jgi:hypothetical protein
MTTFLGSHLSLPQVIAWILERDLDRVREIPEDMLLTTLAKYYADQSISAAIRELPPEPEISGLTKEAIGNIPLTDRKLRDYLEHKGVGLHQLPALRPGSLGSFGDALFHYLKQWYVAGGKSPEEAAILADHHLQEIDDWLIAQGIRIGLRDLVQSRVRRLAEKNAQAVSAWNDTLAELLAALGRDRIKATGRRNGRGDPEAVPVTAWPLMTFSDRAFEERGLLTCACFRDLTTDTRWSDLRFDVDGILRVWPSGSQPHLATQAAPTAKQWAVIQYVRSKYPQGVPDSLSMVALAMEISQTRSREKGDPKWSVSDRVVRDTFNKFGSGRAGFPELPFSPRDRRAR